MGTFSQPPGRDARGLSGVGGQPQEQRVQRREEQLPRRHRHREARRPAARVERHLNRRGAWRTWTAGGKAQTRVIAWIN